MRELDGSSLGKAILGGADIPERGYRKDYGPIRYLVPSEVQEVYSALENFPIDDRTSQYDAGKAEMAKVYVPHHDAAELVEYLRALKEFYGLAAENGEAVLLWIE